ncbi:hypothetical protein HX045_01355 [Myroides odoratimimus]|uniref:hypothetical protein n=1 Tax=Myroides odoratimimus TaxID=76832 RepID=UPI0010397F50|nr:hypothetical protein [Myroides odoratimimus]MCA4791815.1 hypothetical protein [Myroides odoratimimus]MCA4805640.1 hypothetical protein [Myroides odoratimimus]MCA4819076.1 hypothetical protein [Myroides odoratimimus]MDM1059183.1 hypothetical protein [Myroides odoratimimus]MDM1091729.1 hypothetical protein [Myroides odoratimimus]
MRRNLLLMSLLFLLGSMNSYSTEKVSPNAQIKKLTVVSQVVEKNYVPVDSSTLIDNVNVVDGITSSTEVSITKYDFNYNDLGQLTSVESYLVENGAPTSSFNATMELDENNLLRKVTYGENKMSLDLVYDNKILQYTEFKDLYYDESRVSKIVYNRLDLPGSIEISSKPQYSDPEVTDFIYDPNNNLKLINLDSYKTIYTYDQKNYPFAYLPYAYNVSNSLSANELMYTNYNQQNNVVKIENSDLLTTIEYTYNAQDLPLTAKVKTVVKSMPNEQPSIYEYEFTYRVIELMF